MTRGALPGFRSADYEREGKPRAVCLIPNCGQRAPATEPFCSVHREPRIRASTLAGYERVRRAADNIAAALEFVESEAENRSAAGGAMSDYEREPEDAAERLRAAINDLEALL